jgi:predicted nucleic acid-binding protein
MRSIFADTWFFIAWLDPDDAKHQEALDWLEMSSDFIITTRWVLTELANALGGTPLRQCTATLLQSIETDPFFTVIQPSDNLYVRGLKLYASRSDKNWSLTDCISFVVMQDREITEALTGDHHFEQAGLRPVFAGN